jgi:hypothetical protein
MSIVNTPGSAHKCVTCQHFDGERKIQNRTVRYDTSAEGRCVAKKKDVKAKDSGCPKWEQSEEFN